MRVYGAWAGLWDGTAIAEKVVAEGWTQPGVSEQIAAAWREFGTSDTGLVAMPWCEAIARKRKLSILQNVAASGSVLRLGLLKPHRLRGEPSGLAEVGARERKDEGNWHGVVTLS
ncbi:MAG: hypothetical protein OXG37_14130 [Actinomycetia bacterium]|nr:hypothetical protein [Actinomycetes bacterium]